MFRKKNRPVFRGPKKGIFYISERFHKCYFKDETQIDSTNVESILNKIKLNTKEVDEETEPDCSLIVFLKFY